MPTVHFETEEALFHFDLPDVQRILEHLISQHNASEAAKLLETISSSSLDVIKATSSYFVFITLDLLKEGKGSVFCKSCQTTYLPKDLKLFPIGFGESPFSVKELPFKKKGGILKRLFGKRMHMSMFGGKGYLCPEGHELISAITWIS